MIGFLAKLDLSRQVGNGIGGDDDEAPTIRAFELKDPSEYARFGDCVGVEIMPAGTCIRGTSEYRVLRREDWLRIKREADYRETHRS